MSERVGIIARPPNPAWRGPVRAWLEQRSRELRDHHAVRQVRIVDHFSARSGRGVDMSWTLVIEFAHPFGTDAIVRDILADLSVLGASPQLADTDGAA
jgi:hypothetical protein